MRLKHFAFSDTNKALCGHWISDGRRREQAADALADTTCSTCRAKGLQLLKELGARPYGIPLPNGAIE